MEVWRGEKHEGMDGWMQAWRDGGIDGWKYRPMQAWRDEKINR